MNSALLLEAQLYLAGERRPIFSLLRAESARRDKRIDVAARAIVAEEDAERAAGAAPPEPAPPGEPIIPSPPRWYRVTGRADGRVETIAGHDEAAYPAKDWDVAPLEREPGEFDKAGTDGAVLLDADRLDAELERVIDADAGAFRCRFITSVPGQGRAYARKTVEARDYEARGAGPWPMLEAEVEATGAEIAELAAQVIVRADFWAALEPKVEAARLGAKQAMRAAEGEAEKRAAAVVEWDALLDAGKLERER